METLIVILNAKGVRSGFSKVTGDVLTENGFLILDQRRLVLQPEEARAVDPDVPHLASGVVLAFLVQHEKAFETMRALLDDLDDIYYSATPYCALRDKELLFRETRHLERVLVIVKPEADEAARTRVREAIHNNGFNILASRHGPLDRDAASQIFYNDNTEIDRVCNGEALSLVIEKMGAIVDWQLVMGPADFQEALQHAPNSLRSTLSDDINADAPNLVYASPSVGQATIDIPLVFPSPFPVQRTVAFLKPHVVASGATELVTQALRANGFSILSTETLHFSRNRAEIFNAEYKGQESFDQRCNDLSSGPSVALLLAKPAAVETLLKLCGPEDPDVARQEAPGSLRAVYGLDAIRNGIHASASAAIAEQEIPFFFPHIPAEKIPSLQEVQGILLRDANPNAFAAAGGAPASKKSFQAVLVEGLTQLCREKPVGLDAVAWLGNWLLRHNPNKPVVAAPVVQLPVDDEVSASSPKAEPYARLVLCIGGPNGPKDAVLRKVAESAGYLLVSSADVLRLSRTNGSDHGHLVDECISAGRIIPAHITVRILKDYIDKMLVGVSAAKRRVIVNDFPYSLDHALEFESKVSPVTHLLHFDASDAVLAERIHASAGAVEDVKRLVKQYREDVQPIVSHYTVHRKLTALDCNPLPGDSAQSSSSDPALLDKLTQESLNVVRIAPQKRA